MACILSIETATSVCSVALSNDGEILFEEASFDGPSHAALLGVYAAQAVKVAKGEHLTLDAVAVSSGPGSYTGLRIGVSEAKGLCFGYGIPLISIPTLDILATKAIRLNKASDDFFYCAMLDARRMEVYAAIYDSTGQVIRETQAEVVDAATYAPYLSQRKVCFFGNGANKCKDVITSDRSVFLDGIHPMAVEMIPLAELAYADARFVDTVYFEPFYLKEFIATIAKNKVLK
ncbi:tRNA (adenosine(37)-N6)-threonylcarbamoyltransferase complex dimerization subunit type 1 TsaB [Parabacteroides sp. Marseille-P3160]|uniref:tRNA (adenosine(37)-N6)-threonylcarbamoyltransferase complex dimerization subunit type 1 TsaB n=1 Tax=Parabacteroides sp. Marseille-P3160 TaxID=1917887 RepID=UPI0009BADA6B|nr:tRNA (adenosine(37)-N6)-threonylcarbamoyltransferase complex dimerization subunit type 1 TsaB [Parabacteroides sp. Marseille-P3160]